MNKNSKIIILLLLGMLTLTLVEGISGNEFWFKSELWNTIDALVTILTLYLVYLDYDQNRKKMEEITIKLQFPDGTTQALFPIKRKNFSRAELKGILQDFHDTKKGFYRLRYMKEKEFIEKIFEVQDGKVNEFVLKIYPEDFFEFKQ